jgi:hypothetical protein
VNYTAVREDLSWIEKQLPFIIDCGTKCGSKNRRKIIFPLLLLGIGFWMEKIPDPGSGINTSWYWLTDKFHPLIIRLKIWRKKR